MALRAEIVGRQRVDLCDVGHGRDQGGPDRASRADQIPVLAGLLDQTLGDDVHDRVAVADDRVELLVEPRLHLRRDIVPVDLPRGLVAHVLKVLRGVLDNRRTLVRVDRRDLLDHVGDPVCIFHDDLVGPLLAKVSELLEHLLRRVEVERRLALVLEPVAGLDDRPVDRILRIQEMNIARRHAHLPEIVRQLQYLFVDLAEVVVGLDAGHLVADHVFVVADRLDLEIIVEIHDLGDLRRRLLLEDRLVELARRAGGT